MSVTVTAQASIDCSDLGLALAHDNFNTASVFAALFAEWLPGDLVEVADYIYALHLKDRDRIFDGMRAIIKEMERKP